MKENKNINTEAAENVECKKTEAPSALNEINYDPDEYLDEYYDSMFFYDEKCLSCRHWLVYNCGAMDGPCKYEPL